MRRAVLTLVLLATAGALSSCGGGERSPEDYDATVEAEERAEGAQQHPQLLAEFGGAYESPESRYVARLGEKVAVAAGLGGQCTFTLVNTDVVNAFAVPGCFIYVTRGLMGIVNSEAQLASVLAHEVGHIVADHSQRQRRRSVLTGLSAMAVGLLTGSERLASFAGRAAELFTLRYSRQQEFESDALGIHYVRQAGYDPYSAAEMLDALGRNEALMARTRGDDGKSIPGWARTHPLTEDRIARATAKARGTGAAPGALPEGEVPYLRELDGLLYGDDPVQGYVQGRRFAHPEMRLSFEAPPGFSLTNTPRAVLIDGSDGSRGQFGGGPLPRAGLEAYAVELMRQVIGDPGGSVQTGAMQRGFVAGVPTVVLPVSVQSEQGSADVAVAAYAAHGGGAFHFVVIGPPTAESRAARARLFESFRPLSADEVARLRPRLIDVVPVRAGDTLTSMAARMAVAELPLEHFLMLNDRQPDQPLRPGELVKIVTYAGR
jgi:predicted Zn-dependent protease